MCSSDLEHTSELQSEDGIRDDLVTGVQTCALDRKSTRLNSSHQIISYAVSFATVEPLPPCSTTTETAILGSSYGA